MRGPPSERECLLPSPYLVLLPLLPNKDGLFFPPRLHSLHFPQRRFTFGGLPFFVSSLFSLEQKKAISPLISRMVLPRRRTLGRYFFFFPLSSKAKLPIILLFFPPLPLVRYIFPSSPNGTPDGSTPLPPLLFFFFPPPSPSEALYIPP